ncbi:WD repeat-containing protein WRAP73 isoform X3 [Castor canadensis]|uniref:WD repeat-containing protein WRAP73 isoform X3 n=1 Tax=Castor canadensis TaxID=51338 RepID=A0A8B7U880_CASCN|nr:WD repeat-containing protein WRAP73 isoform X4 [Castor canadensis]
MNFSEVFKLSNLLCRFSPDGKYLASCVQYRLVIRDANTLQILQLHTCLDQIQHIEWSADSLFVLCAMYKRGLVQVWSLEQPEWHCKIDEGSAGLVASCWSPDGRHILNTTEFHLRITVWSLCTKSVSYIKYPKACQQGITFTRDGRYLALAERRDCRDYVSIFVCSDWQLLRHFDTDTQDLTGIEWAPNGCVLAVWDTCLEYKILLYSLDGRLLSAYCAYEWSLGIKSVAWSPSSQFLAIGSYDGKARLLNHVTWKMITEFEHPATINDPKIFVHGWLKGQAPLQSVLPVTLPTLPTCCRSLLSRGDQGPCRKYWASAVTPGTVLWASARPLPLQRGGQRDRLGRGWENWGSSRGLEREHFGSREQDVQRCYRGGGRSSQLCSS